MANTTLKPDDLTARDYADRLLLENLSDLNEVVKVSELAERMSDHHLGLGAVRSLLASNPERFAFSERRWVPAARITGQGRPTAAVIEEIVASFNGPISLDTLVLETARTLKADPEDVEETVVRLATGFPAFVLDDQNRVSLTKWGFFASDESKPRAWALNGVTEEETKALGAKLGKFDYCETGAIEAAIKKLAPVNIKVLGGLFWENLNCLAPHLPLLYSTRQFLKTALSIPGYVLGPNGDLVSAGDAKKWLTAAARIAENLTPSIEVEDAQPIEIKPEDVSKISAKILAASDTVTGTSILEEMYEITPGSKTFSDDLANLLNSVRGQDGIVWVGGDRLQKPGLIPEGLDTLPELFSYVESGIVTDEDEPVDAELTDEGLSTTLRKLISHPLATDVLDEVSIPAPKVMPDSQRLVLKAIHRELGTFPLCQFYNGWLTTDPNLQEIVVVDGNDKELRIWVNHKDRIMYNWIDWWLDQPVENGAVFTLTKTKRPNVFDFAWSDQPDSLVYISKQRMDILRDLAMASEGKSSFELLVEIMQHWTKGADFLTLHAEMNIVRRSRARLVASLLSSYECFYQRQNSPVWHFDSKKVELGFNKAKKRFIKK